MNHIYKSIFNKALGVFTAVPEFASAHGKGSERTVVGRVAKGTAGFAASALAISIGLALTSTSAVAAGAPAIYINNGVDPTCTAFLDEVASVAQFIYGATNHIEAAVGMAPGTPISPPGKFGLPGRNPCLSSNGSAAENADTQTNRVLFYGEPGTNYEVIRNLTLGGRLDVNSGIIGVGDRGTDGAGATNSIRMGTGTTLDEANKKENAISIGVDAGASANNAIALGNTSKAAASHSTAISTEANARTGYSIAMGYKAVAGNNSAGVPANGTSAIAIGNQALANYYNAIALGQKAKVNTGADGIAIGSETQVNAYKGTAIGAFSEANGSQSLAIGNNVQGKSSVASGVRSQVIGVESNAVGEDATAIGYKNIISAARTYAMGNNINVVSGADDSVVMGSNNTVASIRTYAIGNNINLASNKTADSLAFGTRAHVSDHDQISLGTDAGADAAATASNANGVAIGQSAGRYAQSGAANTAIGLRAGQYVKGSYNIAMGSNAGSGDATEVLEANNTVAIGNSAKASANNSVAIGIGSNAQAEQTVALGPYATASGKYSTAIGLQARALGDNAIATGNHAAAVGTQQISIGINAGNSTGSNTSPAKAADYGVFIGRHAGSDAAGATGNAYGVGIGFEAGSYNKAGTNNFAIGSQAGQYVEGSRNAAYGQHSGKYLKGNDNVAIGTRAGSGADGDILEAGDTIAIGRDSKASASYATAIGSEAKAKGIDSIAMGLGATVEDAAGFDGIAIGTRAKAKEKGMAVGAYSQADGAESGVFANAVQGKGSTATGRRASIIGVESTVSGNNSVAIGDTNTVASARTYAMGNNINVKAGADDSLAFGTSASVSSINAIAVGKNTIVEGDDSIAIGHGAKNKRVLEGPAGNQQQQLASSSIAIGRNASTNFSDSIAIGRNTEAHGQSSIVIGENSKTNSPWNDATNRYNQSYRSILIGFKGQSSGANTIGIGSRAEALANSTMVLGMDASSGHVDAIVMGRSAKTQGGSSASAGSIAIGTGSSSGSADNGRPSTAIGAGSYVGASFAIPTTDTSPSTDAGKETLRNAPDGLDMARGATAIGANAGAAYRLIDLLKEDVTDSLTNKTVKAGTPVYRQIIRDSNNKIVEVKFYTSLKDKGDGTGSLEYSYIDKDKVNQGYAANMGTALDDNTAVLTKSGFLKNGSPDPDNVTYTETRATKDKGIVTTDAKAYAKLSNPSNQQVAVGLQARAVGNESVAVGTQTIAGDNSVVMGSSTRLQSLASNYVQVTSADVNKYAAARDTVTQDKDIDLNITASQGSVLTMYQNNVGRNLPNWNSEDAAYGIAGSTVLGAQAHSTAPIGVAVGLSSTVARGALGGVALGSMATVEPNALGSMAMGMGARVQVAANNAIALGTGAQVVSSSDKKADGAIAVGHKAMADKANSVALGAGSTTADVHTITTPTDAYTLSTFYTAAGEPNAANGTVSVGSAGKERQIQNVAAGVISRTSTDAINGSQLYATNNYLSNFAGGVKNVLGGDAAVDNAGNLTMSNIGGTGKGNVHEAIAAVKGVADTAVQEVESKNPTALSVKKDGTKVTLTPNFIAGDLVNANGTVNAPATADDEGKLVSAKTVADALKANHFVVDTQANGGTVDASVSGKNAKVGSGNKVIFEAGKNLVAQQTNTENGGATVKFSLGEDISLNSVTAGTGDNQIVLNDAGVNVGNKNYINKDGLNANSKVISNVAAGVKPTDAVNKDQLDAVAGVANSAVQSVDVAANENNLVVDNSDSKNPKLRLRKAVDLDSIKLENNVGEKSFLNSAGLIIKDGPAVTRSGINAGDKKITNVEAGNVAKDSKDAVNGGQLHNVAQGVAGVLGGNAAVDGNGNVTSSDIGGTGANTVDDAIKAVNKAATAAKTTVKEGDNITVTPITNTDGSTTYTVATKKDLDVTSVTAGNTTVNTNGLTITGGPSVTRGGIDAGDRVISGVKAGDVSANSKEAVNGSQLYATNTKLDGVKAKADTAVQDVKSGDENALTAVKDPNTNIVTVTPKLSGDLVDADGNITAPTTPADKGKLVTAGTVAQALANTHFVVDTKATDGELDSTSQADQKIKAGNKVTLQAGKNLKAKQTNGADGAQVEFSLKDSISLTQVTAGEGDNQVVLGNDGVKVGGNTYINKDGLNANNKPISNVADGVKPTDAVNKGQLDAVKGVADSAVKSVDVANGEQNLVVDNTDPKNPKLSLKKDLTVDSVKAGDSTLNTDGLTIAGGPSVKKDGINAGNKKITGVADGNVAAGSTDAVNGGQLYNVANNVKDLIGPDATIDPATGKVTVADPAQGIAGTGKGTIGEAIKSVKDKADTAVQDIKSGDEKALSVTKAGNTYTITPNLSGDLVDADGNITAPATDADKGKLVTAGTVADALANTHFVVDTKATDGELDAASQADQKIKAGNKVTLQAGKNLKAKQTNGTNGAQVEFSLKDSISLTQVTAGTGDNQVVLGNDGVQVGGNTYINKDGLNANNKVISNVADGVNPNDAVNKGQLDAVKGVADSAVKSVDVVANENNLVVDNTDPKNPKLRLRKAVDLDSIKLENNVGEKSFLNSAGLTIKDGPAVTRSGINANNTKVTNVTDGDVNGTSKDAVNGSQLYNVASNVKDLIGPDAAIDPATGKVTVADPTKGIGGTGKGNIGDAIQSVKDAADKAAAEHTTVKAGNNIVVTEGTNAAGGKEYTVSTAKDLNVDSVKAGDTTVNNDGLTIAGGPSVKKDGIDAGDKNITNVADGNVAAGSKDAVNGGQLYDVAKNVADLVGPDATIDPATGKVTVADPTKGIGETGKGTIGDAIKAVNDLAKKAAAEKTSVKAKDGRSNVTVTEGTNAAGGHEYTVDVERAVTEAGSDQVTVTSKHDADSNTTTYTVDVSDKTKASLAKADSAVQGLTSKDGNLNFTKGSNGNVEVSFNDNLNVKNVTTDRVQVANGPSMSKDGINAAGKAISNVANGNVAADSKDAVNGGQLHETAKSVADVIGGGATVKDGKVVAGQNGIGNTGQNTVHGAIAAINQNTANNFNQIRGDLRKMDRDLRGGIAGALATAGLPQAFSPGKSMVAAAAGTYRGQSGLAVGVSRISDNGKVILKVTGNTNSRGDFGGTIGAGYQW